MIINLIINLFLLVFTGLFSFLPEVTLSSFPVIGAYVSNALTFIVLTWNAFVVTFPYAGIAWHLFLAVIIPFEFLLLISRFFLGSRSIGHNIN